MERSPAPPRLAICNATKPGLVLEKLPKQLIDMIMEYVGDHKSLHIFLFSRGLYQHAKRAIYRHLDFVAWDPTSKSAIEAEQRDQGQTVGNKWESAANIRKQIGRIALPIEGNMGGRPFLWKTTTLSIKLSEDDPQLLVARCRFLASVGTLSGHEPLGNHYIDPELWDRCQASIVRRSNAIEELVCD